MLQQSQTYAPLQESRGAATLKDGLAKSLGFKGFDRLVEQMDFWQDAIKGHQRTCDF